MRDVCFESRDMRVSKKSKFASGRCMGVLKKRVFCLKAAVRVFLQGVSYSPFYSLFVSLGGCFLVYVCRAKRHQGVFAVEFDANVLTLLS